MAGVGKRDAGREMLVTAVSGVLGGALSKAVTYPLDISKTWIAKKKSHESNLDVIKQLWNMGVYIGFRLRLLKSISHNFVFFWMMEGITLFTKALVNKLRRSRGLPRATSFGAPVFLGAGFLGDALGIPLFAPSDYILTQVMTSKTHEGIGSVIKRTYSESGLRGFYVGWTVYLLAAPRSAVRFGLFEYVKARMLHNKGRDAVLSVAQGFWLGALVSALGSSLFYPVNTARIVITSRRREAGQHADELQNGGKSWVSKAVLQSDSQVSDNPLKVILAIAREEGAAGLYKGLPSEVAEGMLGAAIQFAVKERVLVGVRRAVYFGRT